MVFFLFGTFWRYSVKFRANLMVFGKIPYQLVYSVNFGTIGGIQCNSVPFVGVWYNLVQFDGTRYHMLIFGKVRYHLVVFGIIRYHLVVFGIIR